MTRQTIAQKALELAARELDELGNVHRRFVPRARRRELAQAHERAASLCQREAQRLLKLAGATS